MSRTRLSSDWCAIKLNKWNKGKRVGSLKVSQELRHKLKSTWAPKLATTTERCMINLPSRSLKSNKRVANSQSLPRLLPKSHKLRKVMCKISSWTTNLDMR